MLETHPTILCIDPGARQIGVAVLQGEDLLYYGVKTIKNYDSPNLTFIRLEQIISTLIREFDVSIIGLEKIVSAQQKNSSVKLVYQHTKLLIEKNGVRLMEFDPAFVRSVICDPAKGTKTATYRVLTEKYPELRKHLAVTKQWQRVYFAHLFDAIAIGFVFYKLSKESTEALLIKQKL